MSISVNATWILLIRNCVLIVVILSDGFNADAPYSLEGKTLDALLQEGDVRISPETIFLLCGNENIDNIRAKVFGEFQKAYPDILTELDLVDRILERFNWVEYQEKLKKEVI